jgi:hypothetical protein
MGVGMPIRWIAHRRSMPSFRRRPESILILLSSMKIKMGPGLRRDDEGEGFAA